MCAPAVRPGAAGSAVPGHLRLLAGRLGDAERGAFLIEAGISSSYHIANFFGLTEWIHLAARETAKETAKETEKPAVKTTAAAEGAPDLTRVLWPMTTLSRRPEPTPAAPQKRAGIDVSAVITRALTAAGLMK